MTVTTKYGEYTITETATGMMAENTASHGQLFLDHFVPDPNYTHDVARTVSAIEAEYEFQHDIPQEQSPKTASQNSHIQDILDSFNFDKVQAYMTDTDWKWCSSGAPHVPSIDELRSTASHLLYEAVKDKAPSTSVSTGGLAAYKFPWGLKLVFELTYRSSY